MKMIKLEKWFLNRPKHAQRVIGNAEKLLHYVPLKKGQVFLELGCGNGAVSKHIAQKYLLNVTGTDLDAEQIQCAQEASADIPNVSFLKADGTNLSFRENVFDVVLSFGVMHHIPNWLGAFDEINRVLKPMGYFIYLDFIYSKWLMAIGRSFQHRYGVVTVEELDSFAERNNYSTIHSALSKSLFIHQYEAVYQKG